MKIEECIKPPKKGSKKLESKEELAKKLLGCTDFNDYVFIDEETKGTIFHWLIIKNEPKVIKKLLETEQGRALALYQDEQKRTLLHYTVKSKRERPEILALLIEHLPQLVHQPDEKSTTALQEAVSKEAVWAIDVFVRKEVPFFDFQSKREIFTMESECSLSLFELNNELRTEPLINRDINQNYRQLASALQIKVEEKYAKFHAAISHMLIQLARPLVEINWQNSLEAPVLPKSRRFDSEQLPLLRLLWQITMGCKQDGIRILQLEQISHQTLGLQNIASLEQIFFGLKRLYSYFDDSQKKVASYMLSQLIYYHGSDFFKEEKVVQLKKIALCFKLEELIRESELFYTCSEVKNFHLLKQWNEVKKQDSFEQLLNQALANKSDKHTVEMEAIAQELQCQIKAFYQAATVKEFLGKKEKGLDELSNIASIANHFNKLSNFFATKILSQPSEEKRCKAMKFFIQFGAFLCSLPEPNLHHLMLIGGVLDTAVISRLKLKLSEKDKRVLQQIEMITNQQSNRKYMRWALKHYPTALPYTGLFLTDLEFAKQRLEFTKQGNCEDFLSKVEVVGRILFEILKTKSLVQFSINRYNTNLLAFLDAYKEIGNEELYRLSIKCSPRDPVVLQVAGKPQDAENLIDLNALLYALDDYLDRYLIPSLKISDTKYPPEDIANQLILCFQNQLSILAGLSKEKIENFQKALNFLKEILPKLIEIYNKYCNKANAEKSLNLSYYLSCIQDIKNNLDEIKGYHDSFASTQNDPKNKLEQQSTRTDWKCSSAQEVKPALLSSQGFFTLQEGIRASCDKILGRPSKESILNSEQQGKEELGPNKTATLRPVDKPRRQRRIAQNRSFFKEDKKPKNSTQQEWRQKCNG